MKMRPLIISRIVVISLIGIAATCLTGFYSLKVGLLGMGLGILCLIAGILSCSEEEKK
jgi:predicted exporter